MNRYTQAMGAMITIILIVLCGWEESRAQGARAALLGKEEISHPIAVMRLYNYPSGRLTILDVRDSLQAIKSEMEAQASARYRQEDYTRYDNYLQDSIVNYWLVYYCLDGINNALVFEHNQYYYYPNKNTLLWFTAVCIEKKEWNLLATYLRQYPLEVEMYAESRAYFGKMLPANPKAVDWETYLSVCFLDALQVNTITKDAAENLYILQLADSLWGQLQVPRLSKRWQDPRLHFTYTNQARKKETMYFLGDQQRSFYYDVLEQLAEHYTQFALKIEDLSRLSDGYAVPIPVFLDTTIVVSQQPKSSYLRAMQLIQWMMQQLQKEEVYTNTPIWEHLEHTRLQLVNAYWQQAGTSNKATICEQKEVLYLAAIQYLKRDSSYKDRVHARQQALLEYYYNDFSPDCSEVLSRQVQTILSGLLEQTNDTAVLQTAVRMQKNLYLGLAPNDWDDLLTGVFPKIKRSDIRTMLQYETALYANRYHHQNHQKYVYNAQLGHNRYKMDDSVACALLDRYRRLLAQEDAVWKIDYKQLSATYGAILGNRLLNYLLEEEHKLYKGKNLYENIWQAYQALVQELDGACTADSAAFSLPAPYTLDKRLCDAAFFAQQPFSTYPTNHITYLARGIQYATAQATQARDTFQYLQWELERLRWAAAYIQGDKGGIAGKNTAHLHQLKQQYKANAAVALVYEQLMKEKFDTADYYSADDPKTHLYRWYKRDARALCSEYERLHPKSEYFTQWDNKTFDIVYTCHSALPTYLGLEYANKIAPNQPFRVLAHVENIDTIYISIIPEGDTGKQQRLVFAGMNTGDFNRNRIEITLPALPTGRYDIIASYCETMDCNRQVMEVEVMPVWLLGQYRMGQTWQGRTKENNLQKHFYIVDRQTGAPLEQVEVLFRRMNKQYDADGNFLYYGIDSSTKVESAFWAQTAAGITFPDTVYSLIGIVTQGDTIYEYIDFGAGINLHPLKKTQGAIFTDRAVYRAGQQIEYKIVVASAEAGKPQTVVANTSIQVILRGQGNKTIATQTLYTNTYGSAHGTLELSDDLLGGDYVLQAYTTDSIAVEIAHRDIQVMAYKRPSFELADIPITQTYTLGDTVCVQGRATALAGYAVGGADVSYSLSVHLQADDSEITLDRWDGYDLYGTSRYKNPSQYKLYSDITTTDDKGIWEICFATAPCDYHTPSMRYQYHIDTKVTDDKGETQTHTSKFIISKNAYFIGADIPEYVTASEEKPLVVSVRNNAGAPHNADIVTRIYRLRTPETYHSYRIWDAPTDTITTAAAVHALLPHTLHWHEDQQTPTQYERWIKTDTFYRQNNIEVALPKGLPQGEYVLVVDALAGGEHPTRSYPFTVVDWADSRMHDASPFWVHSPQFEYQPQDSMVLYIGSSQPDAAILVYLTALDMVVYHQWHQVNGKKKVMIPLDKAPAGCRLDYFVYSILDNRLYVKEGDIQIELPNHELKISYIRPLPDIAAPRSTQNLQLRITDAFDRPVQAEVAVTMYDAALEKFERHYTTIRHLNTLHRFPLLRLDGRMGLTFGNQLETSYTDAFNDVDTVLMFDPETFNELAPVVINEKAAKGINELIKSQNKYKQHSNDLPDPPVDESAFLRTDLSELLVFAPALRSDSNGVLTFPFEMNDALTRWKVLLSAHTQDVKTGTLDGTLRCQKPLMVQPNVPRFVRQRDTVFFAAVVINQSSQKQQGKVTLAVLDPQTLQPVKGFVEKGRTEQSFQLAAGKTAAFRWRLIVPDTAKTILYRIVAQTADFKDGEQNTLVVLSGNSIAIQQQRLALRGGETKSIELPRAGGTAPFRFKLALSYNLSWDILQSLPYLLENPYECSEQLTSRLYANQLAAHIINSNPDIKETLKGWGTRGLPLPVEFTDPDIRRKIHLQTPWMLESATREEDQKRLAFLLNADELERNRRAAVDKLFTRQTPSGGLSWYGGSRPDLYMTLHILQLWGHCKRLTDKDLFADKADFTDRIFKYVRAEFMEQYRRWQAIAEATNAQIDKLDIRPEHLYVLYVESLGMDTIGAETFAPARDFMLDILEKQWQTLAVRQMTLGHIAMTLHRNGKTATAQTILDTLLAHSTLGDNNDRYWQSEGDYWYNAPIETQATLIEAFAEIRPQDTDILQQLKTWLLLQREGSHWATTKATTTAATALMLGGNWLAEQRLPTAILNDGLALDLLAADTLPDAPKGKILRVWEDKATLQQLERLTVSNNNAQVPVYADASLFFSLPLSAIQATQEKDFRIRKQYFRQQAEDGRWVAIEPQTLLGSGDRVAVELSLLVPKTLEYVHIHDQHPSGFEPVDIESGMIYAGAPCYLDVQDAVTNYFFNSLGAGEYTLRREFFVAQSGAYQSGIATMECMYTPIYKAHTASQRLGVRAQ